MKTIFNYTGIIIALFFIFFQSAYLCQSNEKYGFIYGSIVDSVTNEPLIGANIQLCIDSEPCPFGAATDVNGKFKISNIPPGKYNIKISYIGFISKMLTNVKIEIGDTIKLDEVLKDYSFYGEEVAKEEISKGIITYWLGGLVVISDSYSSIPDSIRQKVIDKYGGFKTVLIGCDPTGADKHNAVVDKYLEQRNGKGWRQKMEEELSKLEEYYKNKKNKNTTTHPANNKKQVPE